MIYKNVILGSIARPTADNDDAYARIAEDAGDKAASQMKGKTGFQVSELPDAGQIHLTRDEQFRAIIRAVDMEIDALNATLGENKTTFTPRDLELAQRLGLINPNAQAPQAGNDNPAMARFKTLKAA